MEFSSSSLKKPKDFANPSQIEQKQTEKERDWLELGLGLSRTEEHESKMKQPLSVSASSSSPPINETVTQFHQPKRQNKLELGFGLRFDANAEYSLTREMNATPPGNYPSLWWLYRHHNRNQDHEEMHYHDQDHLSSTLPVDQWQDYSSGRTLGTHDDDDDDDGDDVTYDDDNTPRPHSSAGLWFTLQSCANREGEALPQIPKAYIRVRDENVTVFMVQKYLVAKLGLCNEAGLELSCLGQSLPQKLTLKHVRDSIWLPRFIESLDPTLHQHNLKYHCHLMSLDYKRLPLL